jgi:hypothetical protein
MVPGFVRIEDDIDGIDPDAELAALDNWLWVVVAVPPNVGAIARGPPGAVGDVVAVGVDVVDVDVEVVVGVSVTDVPCRIRDGVVDARAMGAPPTIRAKAGPINKIPILCVDITASP